MYVYIGGLPFLILINERKLKTRAKLFCQPLSVSEVGLNISTLQTHGMSGRGKSVRKPVRSAENP